MLLSFAEVRQRIEEIERVVQNDDGSRGILDFLSPAGSLELSAACLIASKSVAIITGFPCMIDYPIPTETDGPLGSLAIARTLLHLGKEVIILTDECNEEVLLACGAVSGLMVKSSVSSSNFLRMESFPATAQMDGDDFSRLLHIQQSVDLVVAVERSGPNAEGKYRTMRNRDMTHLVAPLELLLVNPGEQNTINDDDVNLHKITSIGIGDGGNEVGMGKVYQRVLQSKVPNAAAIACTVSTDHLIVASVSNWGAYALCAATALLSCFPAAADDYLSTPTSSSTTTTATTTITAQSAAVPRSVLQQQLLECLPSNQLEEAMCRRMVQTGARDGVTGSMDVDQLMVDGMPLSRSLQVLSDVRSI